MNPIVPNSKECLLAHLRPEIICEEARDLIIRCRWVQTKQLRFDDHLIILALNGAYYDDLNRILLLPFSQKNSHCCCKPRNSDDEPILALVHVRTLAFGAQLTLCTSQTALVPQPNGIPNIATSSDRTALVYPLESYTIHAKTAVPHL